MSSAPWSRTEPSLRLPPQRADSTASFARVESSAAQPVGEARPAKPSDIADAKQISKGAKRYWANHLCKYRSADNLVWAKRSTAAADLFVTERSIKIYRAELLASHWICLPEGDAGGAQIHGHPKGLVIHLHPDGRTCNLPKVALKQRTDEANKNRLASNRHRAPGKGEETSPLNMKAEGEESSPSRGKKTSGKGEENVSAIRNELLIELLKEEPSTTTTRANQLDPGTVDARYPPAVDAAGPFLKNFQDPIFDDLQSMCDGTQVVNGAGRARIYRASVQHNFSLEQLRYAWRRDARTETGGVISLAENFPTDTAHLSKFPDCFRCEDTGTVVLQQKLSCGPGRTGHGRRASNHRFLQRMHDDYSSLGVAHCSCRVGIQGQQAAAATLKRTQADEAARTQREVQEADQHRIWARAATESQQTAKETELAAIAALQAKHICPKCAGEQGKQRFGTWHLCIGCMGTGQFFTAEEFLDRGECARCSGTGSIHNSKQDYNVASKKPPWTAPCTACGGSGKTALKT